MGMEKKEKKDRDRIEAVLEILRKQAPLTVKQEKFCNDGCVERFLRGKGDSVKKAAKHLRAVLAWRESIGTEHLIADEFSAELNEGVAYVAGHDDESRPVMVFRIKQDYLKTHSQKSYIRLLVFTLEVAISSMSRFVDQFVLLFDASFFRSASVLLNVFMATLKIISDYYPGRLDKAFVIDTPSLFPYLWKGARPFVEHWTATALVSSQDYGEDDDTFAAYPRASSLRFDHPTPPASVRAVGSTSSRFSFTVSHMDALKPWYLNTVAESPSLAGGAASLQARSFSFASPAGRSTPLGRSVPSTPSSKQVPRTPRPSFLQSPAAALFAFRKEGGKGERGKEAFAPLMKLYRRPYSEMVYRSKMRPPLGGLVSIVAQRRHVCHHHHHHQQRF